MNKNLLVYFLTVLASGIFSEARAQTNDKMQTKFSEEQQKVIHTIEKMANAFHKKDIAGIMACYETEAMVVFEPEKPVSDREQLKATFQEAFNINPQYEFRGHEVFILGDIATHFTSWKMTGTLPNGSAIKQTGLSVAVLRKQKNGQWLMIFDNPHGQFLLEKKIN